MTGLAIVLSTVAFCNIVISIFYAIKADEGAAWYHLVITIIATVWLAWLVW